VEKIAHAELDGDRPPADDRSGMTLKIALVGCGKIADGHVEEIQKLPGRARVVAVCDRELLMAEQMAVRYGLPAHYDSYERMLERERPDVVHITTPPQSHLPLARLALAAGCHLYVEKPLALDHADATALVNAVAAAGKKMTIGYTYLFDPPALEMRSLIAEGAVGKVVHVESWYGYSLHGQFGSAILADPGHWVHSLPGKLFHNNVDHVLNKLTEFVADDAPALDARAWRRHPVHFGDARDQMQDELRLTLVGQETSAYGTFSSHVKPAAHFVRVYGEKNIMHVDYVSRSVTLEPGATLPSAVGRLVPPLGQALQLLRAGARNGAAFARGDFHFFSGLNRLIASFYDCILEDGPLPIATREMLRVSAWMERIFAQIAAGHAAPAAGAPAPGPGVSREVAR
jgi:predicted dehydrogenase